MKPTKILCIMGLLSLLLVGCASPGRAYDDGKVAMIKQDNTTEAQLLEWFGPPATRIMNRDGSKSLSWRFGTARVNNHQRSGRLDVQLDKEGKVTAYSASQG